MPKGESDLSSQPERTSTGPLVTQSATPNPVTIANSPEQEKATGDGFIIAVSVGIVVAVAVAVAFPFILMVLLAVVRSRTRSEDCQVIHTHKLGKSDSSDHKSNSSHDNRAVVQIQNVAVAFDGRGPVATIVAPTEGPETNWWV
jgi:hypothetical protein